MPAAIMVVAVVVNRWDPIESDAVLKGCPGSPEPGRIQEGLLGAFYVPAPPSANQQVGWSVTHLH